MKRSEVDKNLTWDLSLVYKTEEEYQQDVEKMVALSKEIEKTYKGNLNNAESINACLDSYREIMRLEAWTSAYSGLAVEVDYYDTEAKTKSNALHSQLSEMAARLSFIESEILSQSVETLNAAVEAATANKGYLQNLLANKPHQLSAETEKALAALQQSFSTPYQVYLIAKLADTKFDDFEVNGKKYPLSYSLFEDNYQYEEDTDVRRAAFEAFSKTIAKNANTIATAYNAKCTQEKTMATLRGFNSVFDYLLFNQKVTREMYDRQIDVIMNDLAPVMRKFMKLNQKIHNLDKMTYADLKLPLDSAYAPKTTIESAHQTIRDGLSILGEDYVAMVDEAFANRWIDFAQNDGKSTGGFCSSPYGKNSYILLNYNSRMSDVLTLAHELGHAGHFKACNSAQSIFDTDVSTYFVEAPSTMNEIIMANYLLKTNSDPKFQRWVYSTMINGTYYHNFVTHLLEAAYQREVYKIIDAGGSVQANQLSAIYKDVLKKFWGEDIELTDGCELTWMRQPHYYMGLYSYTYSAGLTVATQACLRIQSEGQKAVDDWRAVLNAGSTLDPLGLAKLAGVDISTDEPLKNTIKYLGEIVDHIEELTNQMN